MIEDAIAQEREACATIADALQAKTCTCCSMAIQPSEVAAAIRARRTPSASEAP